MAIGLAALIVLAIAGAMGRFYATRWPTGDVTGFVATGADAVLLFRQAGDDPYFDVEMVYVDRLEGPRWRKGLYRLQMLPERGVTVGPDTITVRASDVDGHLETHAFARDGSFLWRRRAYEEAPEGWEEGAQSHRLRNVVYEVYGGPEGIVHVLRVDGGTRGNEESTDGSALGRVALPGSGPTESRLTAAGLLLRRGDAAWHLSPDLELVPLVDQGALCLVADGVVARRESSLVFIATGGVQAVDVAEGVSIETPAVCLLRDQVLAVATRESIVGLADGAIRWRLDGIGPVPEVPWIAGEVPDVFGFTRAGALHVHEVESGASLAEFRIPEGSALQLLGFEGGLYARTGDQLWRFEAGAPPVRITVKRSDADRFPLSPAHLGSDRLWVANLADARPLDACTLRPLRSRAQLPRVIPRPGGGEGAPPEGGSSNP